MKRLLFIIVFVAILVGTLSAQKTTRKGLSNSGRTSTNIVVQEDAVCQDTITEKTADYLSIKGYDKPLRSSRESFFVVNTAGDSIDAFVVTITYFDTQGRMLHRRTQHINTLVPAGETRQISIRSWDTQKAFYYLRSSSSARAQQATPYDVDLSVDSIFITR